MNYITVKPENLEIALVDTKPESEFAIPIKKTRNDVLERDFHGLVFFKVLYPYVADEDKAKGKRKTAYSLADPDPWLVALAAIMWQGLIQGLTWDMIKLAALKGISFLRSNDLLAEEPYPSKGWKNLKRKRVQVWKLGFPGQSLVWMVSPCANSFLVLNVSTKISLKKKEK